MVMNMKKQFQISIEEILRKTIFVEAENEAEAYQMAEDLYNGEQVVLIPDDFVEYNIYVEGEVTENDKN